MDAIIDIGVSRCPVSSQWIDVGDKPALCSTSEVESPRFKRQRFIQSPIDTLS
jgi:hypothetical protein